MATEPERSAAKFILYFERLVDSEGQAWKRQHLVAQLWLSLLSSTGRTREAFVVLASELGAESDLGTAYDELLYEVGRWAKRI